MTEGPRYPTVDVLMATYNGETYLEEQVQSIQDQTFGQWRLLVCDDGSTDGTPGLIRRLAGEDGRIHVLEDERLHRGPSGRFLWLLGQSDAGYVLFSDQDDVWAPNKVEELLLAARQCEEELGDDVPVLAFCDAEVVDSTLSPVAPSFLRLEHFDPSATQFRRLLVGNMAPGCTMLINRALIDALGEVEDVQGIVMHDWWIMLVAAALGKIAFVDQPLVKYRQHGANVEGARTYDVLRYLSIVGEVAKAHERAQEQAAAFAKAYEGRLSEKDYCACRDYGSAQPRGLGHVITIVRHGLWQQGIGRRVGQVLIPLFVPRGRDS